MTTERVHFRLLVMPCCQHHLCWVNPRLPSYCPECGRSIIAHVKSFVTHSDTNATLRIRS